MENLASKYRPKTLEDIVEQDIVVDILKKMSSADSLTSRCFLFTGPAGTGKAQPLYSKIFTPAGFIEMMDVEVGTEVYTHTGALAEVSGVYPQGVRPIYEIKLKNGDSIQVSDEHLNVVFKFDEVSGLRKDYCITTLDLIKMYENTDELIRIDIPCVSPNHQDELERYITHISYIGDEECQCIMVDHPDHTYISDNFIPTHNTTTGRALATLWNKGANGIIEIDAASNSGVDSVREIVKQASTYPVNSDYKIFIIDECHSISNVGWQAFLKVFEEQPAKSIFFLLTTNPEKIPATILSRVQTFQLSKISLAGIHDRLNYILDKEIGEGREITYTDDAVTFIAKLANGGMRDAITTLDKALAYSSNITMENLEVSLSLPNYNDYFDLLNAVVRKNNEKIIEIINIVYNSGVNFVKWFEGFHSFLCNIVKYIFLRDISLTMIPSTYEDKISTYGPSHSAWCLQLSNKLVRLIADLKRTQYLQEYAITYLCDSSKKEAK